MFVVFLGPPGSGKGTQSDILHERLGFTHFDTGSRLRAEIASGSELGKRIASFTDQGQLVPIEIIKDLVVAFLDAGPHGRVLFDGFPRNLAQAEVLTEAMAARNLSLSCAIYLQIDSDSLIERIVNRRFCPQCGDIYNLVSRKPQQEGICDKDGAALIQRRDDSAEVFGRRLAVYENQTKPVLTYYGEMGLLHTFDGDMPIEEVSNRIARLLGLGGNHAA